MFQAFARQLLVASFLLLTAPSLSAQHLLTPFERSSGKRSATYAECIAFYHQLAAQTGRIIVDSTGQTDAGFPLHTIIFPATTRKDPDALTIMINNGIHAGEPDGIDASMMLLRDIVEDRIAVPEHIRLVFIPVYNIGGALNRNANTRVNQVGPESYGTRGNAQNLDLNRDFIKCDARESRILRQLFHFYDPAIFIDNHVSDGADYQHTMTLLTTQYDKLGGALGAWLRKELDPALYKKMKAAGWPMTPYVNAEERPDLGWTAFNDPPRFSSGYAALFNCIAWVPETHMLKPFDQRTQATYALMKEIIGLAGKERKKILSLRAEDRNKALTQSKFPLNWVPGTESSSWEFKGYEAAYKTSEVTGANRLYFDHTRPFEKNVQVKDHYLPETFRNAPVAYVIPQGWHRVIERILDNHQMDYGILDHDTVLLVTAYHIDSFKTRSEPFGGHYKHSDVHVSSRTIKQQFHRGDYVFPMIGNPFRRFLVETLEPEGDDSYFAWNFFDGILQRNEGYSDFRWEDVAAEELKQHPEIRADLEARKRKDSAFAADAAAQLFYVYEHSRWQEAAYRQYPVYRIE
jgi:hypothetical protein